MNKKLSPKILIVEDENITAMDIETLLRGLGYTVSAIVSSAEQAVASVDEVQPDLVLMDIILKGKTDGVEAARLIRSKFDIPVIYLTAFSDSATVQRAKITEPFGYVLKPFDERDLHTTIEMALYKHKMEQMQRESEERYRRLFELSPEAIVVHDGRMIQLANEAAGKLMGITDPGNLAGKTIMDFIHPDFQENVRERVREQGSGRVAPVMVEKFLRHDGSTIDVEVTAAPIPYHESLSFLVMIRDITERLRAEKALRESEERFSKAFYSSPFAKSISLLDNGRYVDVNDSFLQLVEYTREEIIGHNSVELNLWLDSAGREETAKKLRSVGSIRDIETRFRTKSGRVRTWRSSLEVLEIGGVQHILSLIEDITERTQAEKALRESEERYHTLALTVPDPLTAVDLRGIITFVSQRTLQFYGYKSEDEILGHYVLDWVSNNDKERALTELAALISGGSLNDREFTLLRSDGSTFFAEVSGSCMKDAHGVPIGALLLVRDVTERRELQSQLTQAQKLEAVGRLAGGVAHDFNNMIGIILGYAKLIEDKLNPLDPLRKYVQTISTTAERSANLTKQLLAFARKQVISPVAVNLNESLSSIHRMLIRLIGEDITLTVHPAESLWNIRIDPTQVDQILANISSNARDAIDDVGTIMIETSNIVVDEAYCRDHVDFKPGEFMLLSFRDTGKGMDKATVQRIFEPFFTTKPAGQGTGLGLATVFGIVKQNNGFISVQSEPGKGTTFKIYLPRLHGETETPAEKRDEGPLSGTETVMVVEDEEQLLDLAKSALEMYGYKVLAAKSPGDAILLFEQADGKIDLLISDVVMPGMNGREMKERLMAIKPGMKAIFMSGYTADVVTHRGVLEGGTNFLQKPFTPVDLARKVREVLGNSKADPPGSR